MSKFFLIPRTLFFHFVIPSLILSEMKNLYADFWFHRQYSILIVLTSNAFIFPVVYFFYPETSGRSLEEMDSVFRKCHSYFTVVQIANDEPHRFGPKGELLVDYEVTEDHSRRQASIGYA